LELLFKRLPINTSGKFHPKNHSLFCSLSLLILDNFLLPLAVSADVTITIRNESIASLLEIPPGYPLEERLEKVSNSALPLGRGKIK